MTGAQDKFLIVVETATMSETELAEYARKTGLYVEQIMAWRDACMKANGWSYQGSSLPEQGAEGRRADQP